MAGKNNLRFFNTTTPYRPASNGLAGLSVAGLPLFDPSDTKAPIAPSVSNDSADTASLAATNPMNIELQSAFRSGLDSGLGQSQVGGSGFFSGLLDNPTKLGNLTGLASTLLQAAALPSALETAELQRESLQHNLNTAREEQARRNRNIAGFNRPTSAFAG